MADVAKTYHEKIQTADIPNARENEREDAIQEALQSIDKKVEQEKKAGLKPTVTEEEIERAIRKAENGRAAGIDGFVYEIWKWIMTRFKEQEKNGTQGDTPKMFDPVKMLQILFNSIARDGVDERSGFAEGWMCPIYKKGDKEDIANYRPITLLNADYKIYTKILTEKLKTVAPQLIHMDQAGFVEGRSISDQILLARTTLEYGEIEGINGAIVALDQEKAYDRIAHDYLWRVLKKFGIPDEFIDAVKGIYAKAETKVMINGVLSNSFKVTRGVRQGDPMSCLLFNLAIEPLAGMLRKSTLRGIKAEGATERIIVKLFADDTAVTLAEDDDFTVLMGILNKWCLASRAKFNTTKTEIVPFGSEAFRIKVLRDRKLNDTNGRIPMGMHIVKDKESIRYLGGRIGNDIAAATPWTPVIEKIEKNLERWGMSHPTIHGRKIISQYIPAGMSQYLAMVQTMPKSVEREIIKIIRSFLWDGSQSSTVDLRILYDSIENGGLNLVDIESRNEAIELMKVKSYLNHGDTRASWAYLIDTIVKRKVMSKNGVVEMSARYIPMAQQWRPSVREPPKKATIAKEILTAANKHGVAIDTPDPTEAEKDMIPIWYHVGIQQSRQTKIRNSAAAAICLRTNHKIQTVAQAKVMEERLNAARHKRRRNCACNECRIDRNQKKCDNPHKCCEMAATVLQSINDKWRPNNTQRENEEADPEIEQDEGEEQRIPFRRHREKTKDLGGLFRVFMKQEEATTTPQKEPEQHRRARIPTLQITIDGAIASDRHGDPIVGGGATLSGTQTQDIVLRIPKGARAPEVGAIRAAKKALNMAIDDETVAIRTTCKRIIDCMTTRLETMERTNWEKVKNGEELRSLAAILKKRQGKTYLIHIKKKSDRELGRARTLAKDGTVKNDEDQDTPTATDYQSKGMHLRSLTQNIAYRMIKKGKKKNVPIRKGSAMNVERAQWAIKENDGKFPPEELIWKNVRSPAMRINVKAFFWKMLHDTQKLGKKWIYSDTPQRGDCPECGGYETMEHILLECQIPGQEMLWREVRALWEESGRDWVPPTMGRILGCGLMKVRSEDDGATRLQTILISETAFLLWKLQNERRIKNGDDPEEWLPEQVVLNKWKSTISNRLTMDRAMARPRYGKKALRPELVASTWKGTLQNEEALPPDWVSAKGVLAGIRFGYRT